VTPLLPHAVTSRRLPATRRRLAMLENGFMWSGAEGSGCGLSDYRIPMDEHVMCRTQPFHPGVHRPHAQRDRARPRTA
jgi:hypothetical protein